MEDIRKGYHLSMKGIRKEYLDIVQCCKGCISGILQNQISRAVHGLLNNSVPYLKANYADPLSVRARAKVADRA